MQEKQEWKPPALPVNFLPSDRSQDLTHIHSWALGSETLQCCRHTLTHIVWVRETKRRRTNNNVSAQSPQLARSLGRKWSDETQTANVYASAGKTLRAEITTTLVCGEKKTNNNNKNSKHRESCAKYNTRVCIREASDCWTNSTYSNRNRNDNCSKIRVDYSYEIIHNESKKKTRLFLNFYCNRPKALYVSDGYVQFCSSF